MERVFRYTVSMKPVYRVLLLVILLLPACRSLQPGAAPRTPTETLTGVSTLSAPAPTVTGAPSSSASQVAVLSPLLVDSEHGRLYATGQVNSRPSLLVLDASDGRLLAAWDTLGTLALDAVRQRLVVDRGRQGLVILDAATGESLAVVELPPQDGPPAPQIDTGTGTVYAFRQNMVYVIDPAVPDITQTAPVSAVHSVCDEPAGDAPIYQSAFDPSVSRLYLSFITYTCIPWVTSTLVALDARTLAESGRHDLDFRSQFVPHDGRLFGVSVSRLGPTLHWIWDGAGQWVEVGSDYMGDPTGMAVDNGRGLVYSALGESLRVIDPGQAGPAGEVAVPLLAGSNLASHDAATDTLYFVSPAGRLSLWPAGNLFGTTAPPQSAPSPLPSAPVTWLALSPNWDEDGAMLALVDDDACPSTGGSLFILLHSDAGWQPAMMGAPDVCQSVTAAAFSPDYGRDSLLFAATAEPTTVLRSVDGGRSWTAPETPFPAGVVNSLLLSPSYAADQTAFALLDDGTLYRSRDGGRTWRAMPQALDQFAVVDAPGASPALFGSRGGDLFQSADGESWTLVGPTPDGETLLLLTAAPADVPLPVLYAFTAGGRFARSLDGGLSWLTVVETSAAPAQLAVAAGAPPATRPVFLLHRRTIMASYDDMASIWAATATDEAGRYRPVSIALPPDFTAMPYLFIGTVDGQVLRVDASARP